MKYGKIEAQSGLSGSLTQLSNGSSYLVAGTNVTITSGTNGQVTISSTGGGGGSSPEFWFSSFGGETYTTGSAQVQGGTSIVSFAVTGSVATGLSGTIVSPGSYSHVEGFNTVASGTYSHAEGYNTQAIGTGSHAEGYNTQAIGDYSHAEGFNTRAVGLSSHAAGLNSVAGTFVDDVNYVSNDILQVYGDRTAYYTSGALGTVLLNGSYIPGISNNHGSTIIGSSYEPISDVTYVTGTFTPVILNNGIKVVLGTSPGPYSYAVGSQSTAHGDHCAAYGQHSHAEGEETIAGSNYSHSEGRGTAAVGGYDHAEGLVGRSYGYSAHAEGIYTNAYGNFSHAEGKNNVSGFTSGYTADTVTAGVVTLWSAHGDVTGSLGSSGVLYILDKNPIPIYTDPLQSWDPEDPDKSRGHVKSYSSTSFSSPNTLITLDDPGFSLTGEGIIVKIDALITGDNLSGIKSHSSHAEGRETRAIGSNSHSEGSGSLALGLGSHAEGYRTQAHGYYSHAEGTGSISIGHAAHAEGLNTVASGSHQHVGGKYNAQGNDFSLFVIGDGTGDGDRSDILRVNSGSLSGQGRVEVTGSFASTLGMSGSLTNLVDGTSYLIAGTNVTITSASNGSITISSTGGGGGGSSYFDSTTAGSIFTTGSIAIRGDESSVDSPLDKGSDVFFYVSGSIGGNARTLFGGDVATSGSYLLSVQSGTLGTEPVVLYVSSSHHLTVFTKNNVTASLPTSAPVGVQLSFKDGTGTAGTSPQMVSASLGKIDGSSTFTLPSINYTSVTVVKVNQPDTWVII